MGDLGQLHDDTVDESVGRVCLDAITNYASSVPGEVGADRFAVAVAVAVAVSVSVVVGAAGDLTDRHPLSFERVDVPVVLLAKASEQGLSQAGAWS